LLMAFSDRERLRRLHESARAFSEFFKIHVDPPSPPQFPYGEIAASNRLGPIWRPRR
jgi:hypothetical protein